MSIILSNNIIQPIPFYDSLEKKNSYKEYCGFDCTGIPLVSSDSLFPFMTPYLNFTEINLKCSVDNTLKENLTEQIDVHQYYYPGILVYLGDSTGLNLECGFYYLEIKNETETFYSEDFKIENIIIDLTIEKIFDTEITGTDFFKILSGYTEIYFWQEIITLNEGILKEFKFYSYFTNQVYMEFEIRKDTFDGEIIEPHRDLYVNAVNGWVTVTLVYNEIIPLGTHIFVIFLYGVNFDTQIKYIRNSTYTGTSYLEIGGIPQDLETDPTYGRQSLKCELYINVINTIDTGHDISPDDFHLPIRFYENKVNKSIEKTCGSICEFKNLVMADEIPAFMFSSICSTTGTITAKMICWDDSYFYSKDITIHTIESETKTIYYHLFEVLEDKLECGFFYFEITDGSNIFYSEDVYVEDLNYISPEPEDIPLLNEDGTPLLNEDGTPILNELSI